MNELVKDLRELFQDEEARYAYADAALNTSVAAQIKALREARKMNQEKLAEAIGTKQSGISRLENVNYSSWKVETLRKLARAFHLRLRISFEEFGSLVPEIEKFRAGTLNRRGFEEDPAFFPEQQADEIAEDPAASVHDLMIEVSGMRLFAQMKSGNPAFAAAYKMPDVGNPRLLSFYRAAEPGGKPFLVSPQLPSPAGNALPVGFRERIGIEQVSKRGRNLWQRNKSGRAQRRKPRAA